jgi:hypothetical protein
MANKTLDSELENLQQQAIKTQKKAMQVSLGCFEVLNVQNLYF